MHLGIGLPITRRSGVTSVAPSTSNFTLAQSNGWTLQTSLSPNAAHSTAGRLYGLADGLDTGTLWAGYITGTDAYLTANSDFGTASLIELSISGGAFTEPVPSSGVFPLFVGQSQARRFVVIKFNAGYGNAPYVLTTGTVFSVTGAPPSIEPGLNWVQPSDGNALAANIGNATVPTTNPNYLPAKIDTTGGSTSQNNASIAVRADWTTMLVASYDRFIGYSVDGGAPVYVDRGAAAYMASAITGLSGTHTYTVWSGRASGNVGPLFSVGGLGGTGLSNITSKKYMDQYGDSITEGVLASSNGHTDLFRVAPALGYVPINFGLAGDTISGLDTRISTISTLKTVSSSDVAVLAIGRNNATDNATPLSGADITSYQSCVTKLLAMGYGRIICRAIIPSGDGTTFFTAANASIQSIVTGFANAKVVYCPTSTWTGVASAGDNTHPDDAGYVTLAGYAQPAYAALV